jgi:hypothetical protein
VYIEPPTGPPVDGEPGVTPPRDTVPLDSVIVRLDSMLAVMRQIVSRPTTLHVVPAAEPTGRDTLLGILERMSVKVDSVHQQVRTPRSVP